MTMLRWMVILFGSFVVMSGHAMSWKDWWTTPDRQAEQLWNAGQFSEAAQQFQRPDWRATAAYRAGDYQEAAQNYLGLQTVDGYYNAGNALAKAGDYQRAIAAYNQALQHDAHHEDALFNRQLVQTLLDKQKQSQSDKQQQQQQQQQQSHSQSPQKSEQSPSSPKQDEQTSPQKPAEQPAKSPPPSPTQAKVEKSAAQKHPANRSESEQQQAKEQWLRLIPDDPAYLLREKFLRDHLRRQNGGRS